MAMHGMAEAAQDELVTRYFEQAVAQGMNPMAALELAQRAARDMLGPLRPAATSEEIYGTAPSAERMAAPRVAIAAPTASPAMRMAQPMPAARAVEAVTMQPAPVMFAPAARDIRFEQPDPVVLAPAADDIRFERPDPMMQARLAPAARDIRFEQPDPVVLAPAARDIRFGEMGPDPVEVGMQDMMNARALEDAAARAFNAPMPPPTSVEMERASLADSLLRALGLR